MYKAFINTSNASQKNTSEESASKAKNAGNRVDEHCIQGVLDTEMVAKMMCDE